MKQTHLTLDKNSPAAPLLQILRDKVLAWALEGDERCCTVCAPERGLWPRPKQVREGILEKGALPDYLTRRPVRGKRVTVRTRPGGQAAAISSHITATWPQDGMQAGRMPYIACILQGDAELRIGNFIFHGHAGDFLFLPPETPMDDGTRPHFAELSGTPRHCAILWLTPAGSGLGCWICHSQNERHFSDPEESCYVLHSQSVDLFQTLMQEIGAGGNLPKHRSPHNPSIGWHLFIALLHMLCREIESGKILQFAHQRLDDHHLEDRREPISRAQEYIRSHLHEPLSIAQVARFCYLSRSRFTRRFREETGSSFAEFLMEERVSEAKRLLRETDWNVERICVMVGVHSSRLRALFRVRGLPSPRSFRHMPQS